MSTHQLVGPHKCLIRIKRSAHGEWVRFPSLLSSKLIYFSKVSLFFFWCELDFFCEYYRDWFLEPDSFKVITKLGLTRIFILFHKSSWYIHYVCYLLVVLCFVSANWIFIINQLLLSNHFATALTLIMIKLILYDTLLDLVDNMIMVYRKSLGYFEDHVHN